MAGRLISLFSFQDVLRSDVDELFLIGFFQAGVVIVWRTEFPRALAAIGTRAACTYGLRFHWLRGFIVPAWMFQSIRASSSWL